MTRLLRIRRSVPLTALAMGLLLGLKLAGLGQLLLPGPVAAGAMVAAAQAEPATPAEPPPPAVAAVPSMAAAAAPSVTEPSISTAERQLLQDLRNRRAELDAREQTLQQREGVLNAAENRLTGRIAELTALQSRLERLEAARREHDQANWASLVKVYETMKPREAALIFNDMEVPILLEVIDRMKDAKAALVLAAMQPDRARLVTAQLAAQRTRSTTIPPERAGPG